MNRIKYATLFSILFSGFSFSSTTDTAKDLFIELSKEKFICGLSKKGVISFPKYQFDLKNNIISSLYLDKHKANIFLVRCDNYDFNYYSQCEIHASHEDGNIKTLYEFIFQEKKNNKKIELREYSIAQIANMEGDHDGEQEWNDLYNKYQKGEHIKLKYAFWYGPNQLEEEHNGCSL